MESALRTALAEGASRMGVNLGDEALARFETYLALLQLWGRKINLTARLEGPEVVTHHFLDSLAGARVIAGSPEARVIDIGSGAGLPAFPLKFALPGLRVTLVDSVRKKIAFCQEVIRATAIPGVEAVWGRGEELVRLPGRAGGYDWVVSRAVGKAADVTRVGLPFLAPGGRILLYKGSPERSELESLGALCSAAGATWEIVRVAVPGIDEERSLVVVRAPAPDAG